MKIDEFEIKAIKELGFANISQLLLSYCGLKKENEDMQRTIQLFSSSLYNADLIRYKSVLDEIREFTDNHIMLIYTKNAPREMVGMKELLQILDKVKK